MAINTALSAGISNLGSRLNLPELGISEAIAGDSFSQGLNYSNPINQSLQTDRSSTQNYTPAYQTPAGAYPSVTQAISNQIPGSGTTQQYSSNPTNYSAGPSDTRLQELEKIDRNPVQQNEYDLLLKQLEASRGPTQEEINNAYNPVFGALGQAESTLRGQLPGLISEAEAQAQASRQLLGNQRSGSLEQLGSQATQTEQQRRTGEAQQRQILQELQQANQARFGGASSAGLAASELQGREFQRGVSGINQNAQNAIQQINLQRNNVEREYNQGLQQLEVNRQQAVNDINRRFQDRLLEINSKRAETEAAKSQQRLAAAQELRNAIFQINVQKAQFEQDLRAQAQQNTSYLDNAAQQYLSFANQGQGALDQFGSYSPSAIPTVSGQGTSSQTPLIGSIRNEDLIGSIAGSSEVDPRFQGFNPRQSFTR